MVMEAKIRNWALLSIALFCMYIPSRWDCGDVLSVRTLTDTLKAVLSIWQIFYLRRFFISKKIGKPQNSASSRPRAHLLATHLRSPYRTSVRPTAIRHPPVANHGNPVPTIASPAHAPSVHEEHNTLRYVLGIIWADTIPKESTPPHPLAVAVPAGSREHLRPTLSTAGTIRASLFTERWLLRTNEQKRFIVISGKRRCRLQSRILSESL